MGYIGRLREKEEAKKLRKLGMPYNELADRLSVSKHTLSLWCRDIKLDKSQLEKLFRNGGNGSKRGRLIGNYISSRKQYEQRLCKIEKFKQLGIREVGRLSKREFFLVGIALYLSEGTKADDQIGFSNSDPRIIKFMMLWFRKICKVPDNKFRGKIYIHDNLDEIKARNFWSRLTGIPLGQFHKSYIVKNAKSSLYKNIHPYGVFTIRIGSRDLLRRILGWSEGILKNFKV